MDEYSTALDVANPSYANRTSLALRMLRMFHGNDLVSEEAVKTYRQAIELLKKHNNDFDLALEELRSMKCSMPM